MILKSKDKIRYSRKPLGDGSLKYLLPKSRNSFNGKYALKMSRYKIKDKQLSFKILHRVSIITILHRFREMGLLNDGHPNRTYSKSNMADNEAKKGNYFRIKCDIGIFRRMIKDNASLFDVSDFPDEEFNGLAEISEIIKIKAIGEKNER